MLTPVHKPLLLLVLVLLVLVPLALVLVVLVVLVLVLLALVLRILVLVLLVVLQRLWLGLSAVQVRCPFQDPLAPVPSAQQTSGR